MKAANEDLYAFIDRNLDRQQGICRKLETAYGVVSSTTGGAVLMLRRLDGSPLIRLGPEFFSQ